MTQAYNTEPIFIICHRSERSQFDRLFQKSSAIKISYRSVIIYRLSQDEFKKTSPLLLKSGNCIKTLHSYYLFLTRKGNENDQIVSQFFDYVSETYDELIESQRNFSNIRFQLDYILNNVKIDKDSKILDFGCGTGVSALIKKDFQNNQFQLLGYDISQQMLQKSKKAGLKTLHHRGLDKLKDNSIDSIFASYSLHFLTDFKVIRLIWKKLKIGGIFTANFHKNLRLAEISEIIKSENGTIEFISEIDNSSVYSFKKIENPLLRSDYVTDYLKNHGIRILNENLTNIFTRLNILPQYEYDKTNFILEADLDKYLPFFKSITFADWIYGGNELYEKTFKVTSNNIELNFRIEKTAVLSPFNIALICNLLSEEVLENDEESIFQINLDDVCDISIKSRRLKDLIIEHTEIRNKIEGSRASFFSNSASYMGSKKILRTFLIEALQPFLKKNTQILDIMCGSGAFSGAISTTHNTMVSDAMSFCRILATVQGAGCSESRANNIITEVQNLSKQNIIELKTLFKDGLEKEDILFHSEINNTFLKEYADFCDTYSFKNPVFKNLYANAISEPNKKQYYLLTCAYSNLYFGLRQGIEVDSYRFAIEKLQNENDKIWALGALISTLSAIGNTYGGHFAQPKFKNIMSLPLNKVFPLVEQRTISISNEFAVRLRAFAAESEKHGGYSIKAIRGPWEDALSTYADLKNGNKLIYLDAPYTRDEYSRYYHILETLVDYQYIKLNGIGRVPDKRGGFRFTSEFFTKSVNKFKSIYVNLISKILQQGITCAWSYSDSASVSITEIIYEISKSNSCKVYSLCTPYIYKAQGGRNSKKIKEYLVIFEPFSKFD